MPGRISNGTFEKIVNVYYVIIILFLFLFSDQVEVFRSFNLDSLFFHVAIEDSVKYERILQQIA